MFIFCYAAKNEPKKRARGLAPLTPVRSRRLQCDAQRACYRKLLVLFGTASKTVWLEGAMPFFGEHAADIAKRGECGYKPFWKMDRDIFLRRAGLAPAAK